MGGAGMGGDGMGGVGMAGMGGLGMGGLGIAGMGIAGAGIAGAAPIAPEETSSVASHDDMLIPPGTLTPGQQFTGPVRRRRVGRTPLSLPLYTFPRNVKP